MNFFDDLRKFAETDKIASVWHGEALSYRQLNTEADAFALWLNKYYSQRGLPVAVYGDKENAVLSCIYGANKGGHPYVFLPNYFPKTRLEQILKESGAKLIVICCDAVCPFDPEENNCTLLYANHKHPFAETIAEFIGKKAPDELCAGEDDLWAVYYTSGSTGDPKMVGITGRNIKSKVDITRKAVGDINADGRLCWLDPACFTFSLSLEPTYYERATLGSTGYMVDIKALRDFPSLMQLILDQQINHMGGTSSLLSRMMLHPKFNIEHLPGMKEIILGGEPITRSLIAEFRQHFPAVPVFTMFGSTETSTAPIISEITDELMNAAPDSEILPIGLVETAGDMVRIVNEQGNPVKEGEIGEFLFEGDFVSPGYLNDHEETAKKFYKTKDGKQGFRSGDMGYFRNGYYFFVGRANNMYKIGGYRVEMEDVENALRGIDIIKACAVTPVMDGKSAVMLAAYVVLKENMKHLEATIKIKEKMSKLRPDYMIPQRIIYVDALPVNANNKIDRNKLLENERLH